MAKPIVLTDNSKFTLGFYFQTLTRLLGAPRQFFVELPEEIGFRQPFGFLLISSLFFAGASLAHIQENTFLMVGIMLVNAIGMAFVSASFSFMVMTMTRCKRVPFLRVFSVYAFASGVTMLASWIPLFVWITEPWKWLLITIGLVKGCGLRWMQAILIVGVSIFLLILFFWSLSPVILYFKGHGG